MLNDETRRKLRILNVGEFIEELEIQQQDPQTLALPFDDRFQLLTDGVYQRKYNDKVRRLIKNAKFRLPKADIHDILYIDKRPLNRGIIADLASCRFVDDCRSIVFQGYPSSGKTLAVQWQKKPVETSIRPDTSGSRISWKNTLRSQCFPAERTKC